MHHGSCLTDCYDAVVTNGTFVPGHMNEESYEELARITKKGQSIMNICRD